MALSVPLSRITSRVGGGSAFFVRHHLHAMKKLTLIGLFLALLVAVLLLWMHLHRSKLTGTWERDLPNGVRSVMTVSPDGSYVTEVTGFPDGLVHKFVGTMVVSNGFLIDTITSMMAGTQIAVGPKKAVNRTKIIRIDGHTLVLPSPPGQTNPTVYIKQ